MSKRDRGRILAVKWGLNPNSSSLGVDVTFFLFGAAALSLVTPVLGALMRWRRLSHPAAPDAALHAPVDVASGDSIENADDTENAASASE